MTRIADRVDHPPSTIGGQLPYRTLDPPMSGGVERA
jgi:hypothetical protein